MCTVDFPNLASKPSTPNRSVIPRLIPSEAEGSAVRPSAFPNFPYQTLNPQTEVSSRPERSEVEGPAVPSAPSNLNGSAALPFVIPTEAGGICSAPVGVPEFSVSNPQPPNRSVIPTGAKRSGGTCCSIRTIESEWKRCPPLCHPDRSGGICSAPVGVPEFSVSNPQPPNRSVKRSVAQWRDLLFHPHHRI